MFEYEYARPMLTVDVALIARAAPSVLLIERAHAPFAGCWALPGGFVDDGEQVGAAALRELAEETGIELGRTEPRLLGVYDTPGRDPRGWSVSAVFSATCERELQARGGDDAAQARWWPLSALPPLAFDHALIVADAAGAAEIGG